MIEPFIEVDILENEDDITEFFEEYGYDNDEVYATIVSEEEFDGYSAEFHLSKDDELLAVTASWSTKGELIAFLKQTLGEDFEISKATA